MATTLAYQMGVMTLLKTDGPLDSASWGLFNNQITPTRDTTLAELTKVTVAGMSGGTIDTWVGPFQAEDGVPKILGAGVLAQPTAAPAEPFTVWGWFIANGAGTVLLKAALFDVPVVINSTSDGIFLIPEVFYGDV